MSIFNCQNKQKKNMRVMLTLTVYPTPFVGLLEEKKKPTSVRRRTKKSSSYQFYIYIQIDDDDDMND